MTDSPGGSTAARLIRVLADMPAIEKHGTAPSSMGGYKFRRVEDVTAALKPLFAEHGIICTPRVLERLESTRATSGGKTMYAVNLHIEWTFRSEGEGEIIGSTWGEGTDTGDKATQKAVTAALKSFLTPTFLITDEADDSEAHETPDTTPQPTLTPLEQRKQAWGGKPLPDGWDSFEAMDEKHEAFSAGVKAMPEGQRQEVAAFRAAQEIPWPMSVAQMEKMLEQITMIKSFDAAQEAADGPSGQGS